MNTLLAQVTFGTSHCVSCAPVQLADGGNWIRVAHPLHVLLVLHLLQDQHLVRHLDHRLILLVLQHPLQNQSGPVLMVLLIPKFLLVLLVRLVLLVLHSAVMRKLL